MFADWGGELGFCARYLFLLGWSLGLVGALPLPICTPVPSSLNVFFCLQIDGGKLRQAWKSREGVVQGQIRLELHTGMQQLMALNSLKRAKVETPPGWPERAVFRGKRAKVKTAPISYAELVWLTDASLLDQHLDLYAVVGCDQQIITVRYRKKRVQLP